MNASVPPVADLLDLSAHTAIVSGASGGIGRTIAQRLGEAGARVAVHYHKNKKPADELTEQLRSGQIKAVAIQADLRLSHDCEHLLSHCAQRLGQPSILINNAAIQPVAKLSALADTETRDVLSTNIEAPIRLTRLFAKMQSQAVAGLYPSVTNIASIEALQPAIDHSHYASSKSALIMFTRAAAVELGPAGIRVNAISPGLIDRDTLIDDWPQGVQRYCDAAPLGRIGTGADVADAAVFLSSAAARWISGSNLVVDGGVSCAPLW